VFIGADRKLEVLTKYYASLKSVLPIKSITRHLVSAGVISIEDDEVIQQMARPSQRFSLVLRKVAGSKLIRPKVLTCCWKNMEVCLVMNWPIRLETN